MGVSLKGFNNENEDKVTSEKFMSDKSKKAIKILILMAIAVVFFILVAQVLKNSSLSEESEFKRKQIIQDAKVVRTAVENKANEYRADPTNVELIGASLEENPVVLNVNGIEEEYRYGYYLITPETLTTLTSALNLLDQYYIVNYDTYDVINYYGISYNKMQYHSLEDFLYLEKGMQPVVKQVIRTVDDLEKMRTNPNGYFKLSANLDLSGYAVGEGWKPIEQFGGTLDGRGYTISNLTVSRPSSNNVGLFGELTSTATITNVKFENVSIRGGEYVGTLAGIGAGNISHVTVSSGNVIGQTNYTGGLVGSQNNGTISDCIVTLDSINGNSAVGGLVGISYSGTLTKSGARTSIIGSESVGGAIGLVSVSAATYIQEVCANTQITGTSDLGGLIGKVKILTSNKLDLGNSYSKGAINGSNKNSGGLVGSISSVGSANIAFKSLYTTLDILEKSETSGGCIGYTDIAITSAVSFSDCFWEKDLAPGEVLRDIGTKAENTFTLSFDSKSYSEMRIRNTFANWDFSIWGIDERNNTPYLNWEI